MVETFSVLGSILYCPGPGLFLRAFEVSPSSYLAPMKYLGPLAMKVGIEYASGAGLRVTSLFWVPGL